MTDETLIADLVRAGVSPELVGRVAKAVSDATMSLNVRDIVRDMSREYERDRKRDYRANKRKVNDKPEANDAGFTCNDVPELSRTVPDNRCDLSFFLSEENGLSAKQEQEDQKEKKEPVERRARATRLVSGTPISESDWQFARGLGHHDAEIGKMWVEFVDYWIAIPGQRGTKLDWPATWRNRVRALSAGKKGNGARSSVMAAADDLIARAKELEREAGFGGEPDAAEPEKRKPGRPRKG